MPSEPTAAIPNVITTLEEDVRAAGNGEPEACEEAESEDARSRPRCAANLGEPLASFSVTGAFARASPRDCGHRLQRDGLLHVQGALGPATAEALEVFVGQELARRREDGNTNWFGDVYGYEDTGKRWDMKLPLVQATGDACREILDVLQGSLEALQSSWKLTELAAMCTVPGDPGQPVHADTSHIYDAHTVTIFVALHDIGLHQGPTKMYPRSHVDNDLHMGYKELDESCGVLCSMARGDCVLMDSRLLHCGTANTSVSRRYLFYSSWAQPGVRSRGSTNTLLEEYEDRLFLRNWRDWVNAHWCDR
mmetsp:Transcript_58198/g.165481  ORF Transcript_58198/g.165481 Transcript_58198/m.165481 type:complete len:307 (-) Transcript_58198:94-1014(-)